MSEQGKKSISTSVMIAVAAAPIFVAWVVVLVVVPVTWLGVPITAGATILTIVLSEVNFRRHAARARTEARTGSSDGFTDGDSVEVDCRRCGQFNRVSVARLRDRPICGKCKERLLPGKCVVLCRVRRIEGTLRADLDEQWSDEDRLWELLAEHFASEDRVRAGKVDPQLRVVN